MAQRNISAAKTAKKDEFYTQLEDINNKLKHYREHFIYTAQFNLKTDTTMKKQLLTAILCMITTIANAQIGYQISLLNTATGEARANETVRVEIKLSNNEGEVFYSETKSATTNDFGVLSLSIGNADTFKDVDFTKMPFFIEASANGVAIGKSQILSAPVAEYAKRTGSLSKELLVGTWVRNFSSHWTQNSEYYTGELDGGILITQPYTYNVFCEYKQIYTFNDDGSGSYVITIKSWAEGGYKKYDKLINGRSNPSVDTISYDFTYMIVGDDVYAVEDTGIEGLAKECHFYHETHGPVTITDISSEYVTRRFAPSLHYFPSLNMLGDYKSGRGLTKIK